MNGYFEQVKPTYIENWPAGLINHSVATVHFPLTTEEVDALIAHNIMSLENGEILTDEQGQILRRLEEKIDRLIKHFPRGAFVRLGSRSPKDSYEAYLKKYCYKTGKEAIMALCDSERVNDDLWLAKSNSYTPHIAVREWIVIHPWQEFRCFIRNKKLVGISQYNYLHREVFSEIKENADRIEWALRKKAEAVAPILPADDVIVDFVYKMREHGDVVVNEVILLEVNPYSPYTDPCLFNWSKDKFENFEFRFNR